MLDRQDRSNSRTRLLFAAAALAGALAGSGRFAVFTSEADNLGTGDSNEYLNLFQRGPLF